MRRKFYLYSYYIISIVFYTYFFIYMLLDLEEKSLLFNYLLILLFGVLIGYIIANKAHKELDKRHDSE